MVHGWSETLNSGQQQDTYLALLFPSLKGEKDDDDELWLNRAISVQQHTSNLWFFILFQTKHLYNIPNALSF